MAVFLFHTQIALSEAIGSGPILHRLQASLRRKSARMFKRSSATYSARSTPHTLLNRYVSLCERNARRRAPVNKPHRFAPWAAFFRRFAAALRLPGRPGRQGYLLWGMILRLRARARGLARASRLQALAGVLQSQSFLDFRGYCGGYGLHFGVGLGFDHDSRQGFRPRISDHYAAIAVELALG
jgi:hypothetical protein